MNHIESKHIKILAYPCQFCDKSFYSKHQRTDHYSRMHRQEKNMAKFPFWFAFQKTTILNPLTKSEKSNVPIGCILQKMAGLRVLNVITLAIFTAPKSRRLCSNCSTISRPNISRFLPILVCFARNDSWIGGRDTSILVASILCSKRALVWPIHISRVTSFWHHFCRVFWAKPCWAPCEMQRVDGL